MSAVRGPLTTLRYADEVFVFEDGRGSVQSFSQSCSRQPRARAEGPPQVSDQRV
jgi:hypothetical protein